MITVIEITHWHYAKGNSGDVSGLSGQITKCELNGVVFYVRENTNGIDSFQISSCERWGDKTGKKPGFARQCLELAAPETNWNEIAEEVKKADRLKRAIHKSKLFTLKSANQYFI